MVVVERNGVDSAECEKANARGSEAVVDLDERLGYYKRYKRYYYYLPNLGQLNAPFRVSMKTT